MPSAPPAERDQPPRAALIVFAALLIAGVCGLFAWAQALDGRVIGVPLASSQGPITSIDYLLDEPAKRALDGRRVRLDAVPVQAVPGDYVLWIGASAQRSVPVLLTGEAAGRQPEGRVEVELGDRVMVWGTAQLTTSAALRLMDGLLDADERRRLREAPILIVASQVRVLDPSPDGTRRAAASDPP